LVYASNDDFAKSRLISTFYGPSVMEDTMKNREYISIRRFVSLLLTFSFVMLAVSGICLYVAPQCRVAEEIGWRMLGLAKDRWESIHMTAALAFLILTLIHLLVYNWKTFVSYCKPKAARILSMAPELALSVVIAVLLLVGAALILPPFSFLPDVHDAIQSHYREKSGIDERGDGRGEGRRGGGRGGSRQGDGAVLEVPTAGTHFSPAAYDVRLNRFSSRSACQVIMVGLPWGQV